MNMATGCGRIDLPRCLLILHEYLRYRLGCHALCLYDGWRVEEWGESIHGYVRLGGCAAGLSFFLVLGLYLCHSMTQELLHPVNPLLDVAELAKVYCRYKKMDYTAFRDGLDSLLPFRKRITFVSRELKLQYLAVWHVYIYIYMFF